MKKTTKFYLALMLVAAMISACGAPAPTEPPHHHRGTRSPDHRTHRDYRPR